jgi:hypothetical protein
MEEKRCAMWGTREVNHSLLACARALWRNCFLSRSSLIPPLSFSSFFRLQAPLCVLFRYKHGPNILARPLGPVHGQDKVRGPPGMRLRGRPGTARWTCDARWGPECGSSGGQGELSMPRGEIRFRHLTGQPSSRSVLLPPHVTVQCGAIWAMGVGV